MRQFSKLLLGCLTAIFTLIATPGQARGPFWSFAEALAANDNAVSYRRLAILEPKDNSAFWNSGGFVTVKLRAYPPLDQEHGHRVRVFLDSKLAATGSAGEVTLTNVERGTHLLYAEIVDNEGTRLVRSRTIQFTLHQHSILRPEKMQDSNK